MQAMGGSTREGQPGILRSQDRFAAGIAKQSPSEQGATPAYDHSRFHNLASNTKGILKVKIPLTWEYMDTHYTTYQHSCDLQKAVQPATT